MKILVAGASGRVGQEVVSRLAAKGHEVVAGARRLEAIPKGENIYPVFFDLKGEVADIVALMDQVDAVIFTAGSRGKDLLQIDAFGAVKVMMAAEQAGVQRFVMLSSVFALEPERWSEPNLASLLDYNIAKFFADNYLIESTHLDYTILQAGGLVAEGAYTGKITTQVTEPGRNSIANVAETLAVITETPETIGKVILMADGNIPIKEALLVETFVGGE